MAEVASPHLSRDKGRWISGDLLTNPTDTTVLVDSGPLNQGLYLFAAFGSGSVAFVYDIQHRNAANNASLSVQRRRAIAGNEDTLLPSRISLREGERVRLVLVGNVTGDVQMSLFEVGV